MGEIRYTVKDFSRQKTSYIFYSKPDAIRKRRLFLLRTLFPPKRLSVFLPFLVSFKISNKYCNPRQYCYQKTVSLNYVSTFWPLLKARIISSENYFTFFIDNTFRGFDFNKIRLGDFVPLFATYLFPINGVDNFFAPVKKNKQTRIRKIEMFYTTKIQLR